MKEHDYFAGLITLIKNMQCDKVELHTYCIKNCRSRNEILELKSIHLIFRDLKREQNFTYYLAHITFLFFNVHITVR